ncbi:MAG: hypothetical protein ABI353_07200 [Isosphaeraceae bacterium]
MSRFVPDAKPAKELATIDPALWGFHATPRQDLVPVGPAPVNPQGSMERGQES